MQTVLEHKASSENPEEVLVVSGVRLARQTSCYGPASELQLLFCQRM